MRVLVTGASGAIGRRLVRQLVEAGHEAVGTARSRAGAATIARLGGEPLQVDLLDARAVERAVREARPDAIVHEATALAGRGDLKHFDRTFAETNRLRTVGTDALVGAAADVGVRTFAAQSYAGWPYGRTGDGLKTEEDPLDPHPLESMRDTLAALVRLERAVVGAGGTVLRYGSFYGDEGDAQLEAVRNRRLPIVGDGGGVWSFVHLDDAAAATVLALERRAQGVYNVVDDDPAPVREWLPVLARTIGAKPPRRVPVWIARLAAGEAGVALLTQTRGVSNAKAKRELGLTLRHPSWRTGFAASYRDGALAAAA
jgi:nucleoside-diphosphate-sugar epimerase